MRSRQKIHDKELQDTLKLDEGQLAQVNKAYDLSREQVDQFEHTRRENMKAVNEALHDKIRGVLRPNQLPLYENLLLKWETERKQRMEKMKQQGPSGR